MRVSRLADSVFYAVAVLADGSEVDARPSDALTLALVTGAPIAVEPAVLDASERFARERPGLAAEVSAPADSASVLADEVRARLARARARDGRAQRAACGALIRALRCQAVAVSAVVPTTPAKIVTAVRSDSAVESRPTPMAEIATPE